MFKKQNLNGKFGAITLLPLEKVERESYNYIYIYIKKEM